MALSDPSVGLTVVDRRPGQRRRRARRVVTHIGPLVPAVVLILLFFAGPILWAVRTSLTNQTLSGLRAVSPQFVGFDNFVDVFTDSGTLNAILRTVVFVLFSVLGQNVMGMALALLMRNRNAVVRGLVTVAVVGAWVIPEIVAAFTWYAFLSPDGSLNEIVRSLGLPGQQWLVDSPLVAVIVTNIWRGSAFSMLIYSAAVSDIDPDLLEAAEVDGASLSARVRYIMLPSLRPIIATNLMLTTLQNLGVFGLIYAMTAGGPNSQSETLPILMYTEAFKFSQIGSSNAISLVLLLIGGVFAAFYLIILRRSQK